MSPIDPYFDESIEGLRNLLGAESSQELKEIEPQIVFANELELESILIPRTNDLAEASRLAAEQMDLSKLEIMFARIVTAL